MSAQKTIFITGSSSGLGRATAKLFASKGWKVIATMRNPETETELNQLPGVVLLPLDVTDPEQIKSAVDQGSPWTRARRPGFSLPVSGPAITARSTGSAPDDSWQTAIRNRGHRAEAVAP